MPADPKNDLMLSGRIAQSVKALTEFWSTQDQEEAQPIPIEVEDMGAMRALADEQWVSDGPEIYRDPTGPGDLALSRWEGQPASPAGASNTELVPDRGIMPYCAVGKLFMTFDGARFVGSAWTIADSAVFTAGHCLYDANRGGWADNILFVPQYAGGAEPIGRWAGVQLASLRGWTENRDFRYDLAAFKTDRPIAPATGTTGWLANADPNQGAITGAGYPASGRFDGRSMWRSTGANRGGANPIQMFNDMTGGCSGGPWEIWRNGLPLANGINSFRYNADPASLYSPYFGEGFLNVYGWARQPAVGLGLDVLVHLENIGDAQYSENQWAGTSGQSRRLEGFQIGPSDPTADLSWEYMAHLEGTGDTGWIPAGQFVGTRGQSRRLEGFAIRLTGPQSGNYTIQYRAHLQNIGNTQQFADGAFCGTRGQSRRVEAILVRVVPR